MVSQSVCASIFLSFRLLSLFLHHRSQTPPWENNHEAVYRKIMLYSNYSPHLSYVSDTLHSVLPSCFHSILTAAFSRIRT